MEVPKASKVDSGAATSGIKLIGFFGKRGVPRSFDENAGQHRLEPRNTAQRHIRLNQPERGILVDKLCVVFLHAHRDDDIKQIGCQRYLFNPSPLPHLGI